MRRKESQELTVATNTKRGMTVKAARAQHNLKGKKVKNQSQRNTTMKVHVSG